MERKQMVQNITDAVPHVGVIATLAGWLPPIAAAFCAGQAHAQELTGTLKNVKETGAITIGFRDSSIPFSYLEETRSRSATPWTSATRSSTP